VSISFTDNSLKYEIPLIFHFDNIVVFFPVIHIHQNPSRAEWISAGGSVFEQVLFLPHARTQVQPSCCQNK
jgi:hypothetical protein